MDTIRGKGEQMFSFCNLDEPVSGLYCSELWFSCAYLTMFQNFLLFTLH